MSHKYPPIVKALPLLCLLCIFVLFFEMRCYSEELAQVSDKFKKQALESWQKLKMEYLKGFEMEIDLQIDNNPARRIVINFNGQNELNHFYPMKDDLSEMIIARNSEYLFRIKKTVTDGPWSMGDFIEPPPLGDNPQYNHGLLESSTHAFRGFFLDEGWISELVLSDTFKIKKIEPMTFDDTDKVTIEFESLHNLDKYNQVIAGTLTFDPSRFWVLTNSDVQVNFNVSGNRGKTTRTFNIQTKIEYTDIESIPFPKKATTTYVHPDRKPIVNNAEYIEVSRNIAPDETFYLSHYGFAEPNTPTKRGNRIRIVFIAAGIILICLGLYLRRQGNKA